MGYPPEPWSLCGRMTVSVWAVPVAAAPPLPVELRGAVRVVRAGSRAFVGAAWVDYRPGGDMSYRELLAAVLVRAGIRPRVTISHIWVDSVDSRDGGRELWGIPKELAALEITGTRASAGSIASAGFSAVRPLLRLPVRFRCTQVLHGRPRTTPVRATARCGTAKVGWDFAPDGPLGFLAGRRPLVSLVAEDFRMSFGAAAQR
ncbi:acetoacetate decarboxylase family protein [Dactylosporangium sp. CA-139114]|uniref:acetoacetate decarboxylase family protein n=1 Tax=Dactylosporangium sp. CA-139114 TaxID=3239931 RepID=UPI003D966DC8